MRYPWCSTPVKNGVTLLVDKAERLYNYLFGYELLQAENEQLQAELANMNQDIRDAQTYKTENERLRELENLTEKHTDYDLAIANVVSRSGGSYGSTMTISQAPPLAGGRNVRHYGDWPGGGDPL